jgi:ribosomal protein L12E/L44/L45/RPP1/RPP2
MSSGLLDEVVACPSVLHAAPAATSAAESAAGQQQDHQNDEQDRVL